MANYLIIQALRNFNGSKFPVKCGEKREIRYGYDNPDYVPRIVQQVRNKEDIDWGGAIVSADFYHILFDGPGPLPLELR